MIYSYKSVVSSPTPFQMVYMLMVLFKTTTSARSSHSFSPHSFFSTPHTPDSPNGQCKLPKLYCSHLLSTTHCFPWLFQCHNDVYVLPYTHLPFFQFYLCPFPDPYNLYTSAPWWLLVEFMFLIAHLIMDFVSGLQQPHMASPLLVLIGMLIPHVLTNWTNRLTYFHLPLVSGIHLGLHDP